MNSNAVCTPGGTSIATYSEDNIDLWTTAQAAQALNRSERSVRRLVQRGTIQGFKVRGRCGEEWRIMPFKAEALCVQPKSEDGISNIICSEVASNPFDARIGSQLHSRSCAVAPFSQAKKLLR